MDKDVKSMTDKELDDAIEKKYGADWNLAEVIEIKPMDELIKELIYRLGCADN